MKILYDGEIYSIFRHGGVVRYFYHLISGLSSSYRPILLGNQMPEIAPQHPKLELAIKSHAWAGNGLKPVRKWLERGFCSRKWVEFEPDLIHPTYYNEVARGRYDQRKVPMVLTVYDMIHERFPDQVDRRRSHSEKKRQAIQRADHLLCISETTRQDLLERFQIPAAKTSVTLLAVDELFFCDSDSPPDVPQEVPYFLFIGRRDPYKNFSLVLQAMDRLQQDRPDHSLPFQLHVLGAPLTAAEREEIQRCHLTAHVHWESVKDDLGLRDRYRQSLGLVFPSLWEGFGLPLLEALAAGTCVIASDIPVFRELVDEGFEAFDPGSADSLSAALWRIYDQPQFRQQRIQLGQKQLGRYRWENTVAATEQVYRSLVQQGVTT